MPALAERGVPLAVRAEVEVPEHVEPVVHRHDDHVAAPAEALAVVGLQLLARPGEEPAAVDPHQHGPLARVEAGRPHVDAQAVLARLPVVPLEHERLFVALPAGAGALGTRRAVVERAAHARPRCRLGGRHEPRRAPAFAA